jgi:hypothetical protein
VGSLTSHNPIGLQGLLRDSFTLLWLYIRCNLLHEPVLTGVIHTPYIYITLIVASGRARRAPIKYKCLHTDAVLSASALVQQMWRPFSCRKGGPISKNTDSLGKYTNLVMGSETKNDFAGEGQQQLNSYAISEVRVNVLYPSPYSVEW